MDYFKNMESKRITWGFNDVHRQVRDKAEVQYNTLCGSAIVHGDLQLRNILVHNDLNMHLIDYAGSGPGHPAIDLVRLELALYVGCLKQLEDELQYVKLQEKLSIEMLNYDKLAQEFPESFRAVINRVCMRGCVAARDNAIEAAKAHTGTVKDYLAAKYLVAWQNLIMGGRQASLARSVICALAPAIDKW
jgi:tRNA A-37 threonylcarbamoyl transferase component Bud32